jgi:hypothetical protein
MTGSKVDLQQNGYLIFIFGPSCQFGSLKRFVIWLKLVWRLIASCGYVSQPLISGLIDVPIFVYLDIYVINVFVIRYDFYFNIILVYSFK